MSESSCDTRIYVGQLIVNNNKDIWLVVYDLGVLRRVWRYQRGNDNPLSFEEGQTIQWTKEKVQKDKQWSTKYSTKH